MTAPRKIAVLGGGCGGLAAAWALTATPELRDRFDVTVYERSWRLGGKGASGRSAEGNGSGQRIEEHGLHIWFGFYAHAFQMLREAYEESGLASGDDWWQMPFEKCDSVSLYELGSDREWIRQPVELARADGPPPTEPRPFSARRGLARASRVVAGELRSGLSRAEPTRGGGAVDPVERAQATAARALDDVASELERAPDDPSLWTDDRVVRRGAAPVEGAFTRLLAAADALESEVDAEPIVRRGLSVPVRRVAARVRMLADTAKLLAATIVGFRAGAGRVPDDLDFRSWLKAHGARAASLDRSPVLRGLYDLTFAYIDGDKRRPDLAAGKALQSLLWMIDYEGAFMWRMRAGMGDVVFSPLYLALKQRGVKFHFFSRVTRMGLAPDAPLVDRIELVREADVRAGADAYEPLERIGAWWCWPATPESDQLSGAPAQAETLTRGTDFDDVVLGIPVGALPDICGELAERDPRFAQMLQGSKTVRTKALQLWLTKPIEQLRGDGGRHDSLDAPATAYAEPFDTYCDMSHLLEAEGGGEAGPRAVAYFCAVLEDSVAPERAEEYVLEAAKRYLERDARAFWPGAFDGDRFDWNVLFDPQGRNGAERLRAQYVRANVDPSDRYVRTPAGGIDTRLDPDRSGFDNLVLAGDWTHNVIDGGCVEAAVISGLRAGSALVERSSSGAAGDGRLPAFIEFGALATAPAPLVCDRLRLFGLPVKADLGVLRDLCQRVLDAPTDHQLHYEPQFSRALLVFSVIDGMRSDADSHRELGSARYREAGIWVPTFRDGRMTLFMPFLWLDDPVAIASGREMYGFAKTFASIGGLADPESDPWPPARADELRIDAHGLGDDGRLGMHELLTVSRPSLVTRGADEHELAGLPALVEYAMRRLVPPWLADAHEGLFRHVLLKQFRDAEHPDRAAIQQVVEAVSTIDRHAPQRWRLTGPRELELSGGAGTTLTETLGMPSSQRVPWGFVAEFGFRLEPGQVVWPPRDG